MQDDKKYQVLLFEKSNSILMTVIKPSFGKSQQGESTFIMFYSFFDNI
jgi:hypothetical protein